MKPYLTVLNLLLIAMGVYLAVDSGYALLGAQLETAPVPTVGSVAPPTRNQVKPAVATDYQVIIARDLFHTANLQPLEKPVQPVTAEPLTKTALKLKLWGTATGPMGDTYAVIEPQKDRRQNLYRVGNTIDEAVIKEIRRGQVVLEVNGRHEVLEMEQVLESAVASTGKSVPTPPTPRREPVADTPVAVSGAELEKEAGNLSSLLKQARIRPYINEGKPQGVLLMNVAANSVLRQMGLQNGDVITGINGEEIRSVSEALDFYRQLRSSANSKVSLSVLRQGRNENIDYEIK